MLEMTMFEFDILAQIKIEKKLLFNDFALVWV